MGKSHLVDFMAFTAKAEGRIREIVTDVGVYYPIPPDLKVEESKAIKTKALWDTGATQCAITKDVVAKLELKPSGFSKVIYGRGERIEPKYRISLFLPNKIFIPIIEATECESIIGKFGIIIGMNLITHMDFSITNVNGKTTFSIRMPSVKEADYVKEAKVLKKRLEGKIGRNEPCICGSGKKYKHCCGSTTTK